MTKQSKITAQTATDLIDYLPLDDLYLSEMNPRQETAEDGIALLADSIATCGLIQNLSGLRDDKGTVGIVAGGRRLRALRIAVEARPDLALVPVRVTEDVDIAEDWANAENTAREELDAVDEVRAYGKMAAKDSDVARIARAFGVSEAHVRRRLALAHLPASVLDAAKAGEVTLSIAKAMTVSDNEAKVLEVLERAKSGYINEYTVKQMLKPDAADGDSREAAFVGLEAYEAAGGGVSRDLFEDETLLDNPDILERLFAEKLDAAATALQEAEGWAWAMTTEDNNVYWYYLQEQYGFARVYPVEGDLTDEQTTRYEALEVQEELSEDDQAELAALEAILTGDYTEEQKRHSGIMVHVAYDGTVQVTSGLVRKEDQAAAIEAGLIEASKHSATVAMTQDKPEYSQKFIDDMRAIRLASVQTALLDKPQYALDLLAFAVSPASGSGNSLFGFGYGALETNKPEVDDNFALDARLGGERDDAAETTWEKFHAMTKDGPVSALDTFRAEKKQVRNGMTTAFLARAFKTQSHAFMEKIEAEIGADIRAIWTPSDLNCFKRLKGDQLDALFKDLLELDEYTEDNREFEKMKKGEKVKTMHSLFHDAKYRAAMRVTPQQAAKIAAWVPDCFNE